MSTEWIQLRRDELRSIVDDMHVSLVAPSNKNSWCTRCRSQINNSDTTIEKHLFSCKLKDIVPNPKNIQHDATTHQFYYTNCPAVVSLLQPPHRVTRDYAAELQHLETDRPRAPLDRPVNLSDMVVEHQLWQHTGPPLPVHTTQPSTSSMQVSEYAVSTQGRGAELMTPVAQSVEQHVQQRVNQFCAALWQEQQSLAARSQFYEAVEWTARAEREQSGVASIDAQALEDWLQSGAQLQNEQKRARQEQERDHRSRPEKYRAKNLITKKRPAELQRDLVQLLFSQLSDTSSHTQSRDSEQRVRDRERDERERHRERDRHHREYVRSDREREYQRSERDYERRGERDSERDYERRGERDSERDYERHRERREEQHDRKRRHESSEEHEGNKRQRYR